MRLPGSILRGSQRKSPVGAGLAGDASDSGAAKSIAGKARSYRGRDTSWLVAGLSIRVLPCCCVVLVTGCVSAPSADPPRVSPATTPEAAGLVDIARLVPDIDLDIRYAGMRNFTGARVDGYEAPRCYLLRPAAEALARVERSLRAQGHRLRLYDCYRPMRAVRQFVRWAADLQDQRTKAEYYPNLDKSTLMPGYLSNRSGHSRGATIDLTLMRCDGDACAPLDMGTPFDFFDPRANTDHPGVTAEQRRNRDRLRDAMAAEGFANYAMEWWHYTLKPEPSPELFIDVPVR